MIVEMKSSGLYHRIYEVIRLVPAGRVATYGQIAAIVGECSARTVGYALAALRSDSDVPWHRVVNYQGRISLRAAGMESQEQRARLEAEGIHFDSAGRIDLTRYGWPGPTWAWLMDHGLA